MRAPTPWALIAITAMGPASWGTTYFVTTEWLPADRPLLAATVRALPVGLLIVGLSRTLPSGEWWLRSFILGGLNIGLFFALLFVSAYRLPGGVAAMLGAAQPLLVTALAVLMLGDRLRPQLLVAGGVGLAGVALIVLKADARLDTVGVLAGLAAPASMALGVVLAKKWSRPAGVGPLPFTGWLLTAGGLLLLPMTLLVEGAPPPLSPGHMGGFAYLALINTGLAYLVWFRGLERLPAASVAFLGLLSPVVAALVGWLALSQALTLLQCLGMALAFAGMIGAQLAPRERNRPPEGERLVVAAGTATRARCASRHVLGVGWR